MLSQKYSIRISDLFKCCLDALTREGGIYLSKMTSIATMDCFTVVCLISLARQRLSNEIIPEYFIRKPGPYTPTHHTATAQVPTVLENIFYLATIIYITLN